MPQGERSTYRVMIVAGEASGDLHGANLVTALRQLNPEVTFFGIGGTNMRTAGVDTRVDLSELAVMGLVEVLLHYRRLRGILRQMQVLLREERPDLLITVDYPGFNLRLAKTARALGIKVLHYISPQVWAWREHRVKTIAERVDKMAVLLPFEVPFYEKHGVPVRFVGHPLVDSVKPSVERSEAQRLFGLVPSRPTIGLLPGSRRGELKRLMPVLLESAALLKRQFPDLQLLLPLASSLDRQDLSPWLRPLPEQTEGHFSLYTAQNDESLQIKVVEQHGYDVMQSCDAIITASGTATLEVALMNIPMVIVYKVSPLTYTIARRMISIPNVGLVNIVADELIAPEFIQHEAKADTIAAATARFLTEPDYAQLTREKLAKVRQKLGKPGGSENVAQLALEMLDSSDYY